jgi:hypothetical protein
LQVLSLRFDEIWRHNPPSYPQRVNCPVECIFRHRRGPSAESSEQKLCIDLRIKSAFTPRLSKSPSSSLQRVR